MIHNPIELGPIKLPPLAGARSIPPSGAADGEAGHPAGVSSLLSPPGNHSTEPAHLEHSRETGRTTGAGGEGGPLPSSPANAHSSDSLIPVPSRVEGPSSVERSRDAPVEGRAIEAVLAERTRQIAKFGHTPESDAALPLKQLPREAARFLTAAIEDVQYQRDAWRNHARRHLIRAAAMILAAMDRIEAEPRDEDPFIQSLSKDPL